MERIQVSSGSWDDLTSLLHVSTEIKRTEGIRWFRLPPPQWEVLYTGDEPVAVRIMGTMLMIERRER